MPNLQRNIRNVLPRPLLIVYCRSVKSVISAMFLQDCVTSNCARPWQRSREVMQLECASIKLQFVCKETTTWRVHTCHSNIHIKVLIQTMLNVIILAYFLSERKKFMISRSRLSDPSLTFKPISILS
jgi:hypothetical protein